VKQIDYVADAETLDSLGNKPEAIYKLLEPQVLNYVRGFVGKYGITRQLARSGQLKDIDQTARLIAWEAILEFDPVKAGSNRIGFYVMMRVRNQLLCFLRSFLTDSKRFLPDEIPAEDEEEARSRIDEATADQQAVKNKVSYAEVASALEIRECLDSWPELTGSEKRLMKLLFQSGPALSVPVICKRMSVGRRELRALFTSAMSKVRARFGRMPVSLQERNKFFLVRSRRTARNIAANARRGNRKEAVRTCRIARHVRWHVRKGIIHPDCPHCAVQLTPNIISAEAS
jgi:hypothetical protein